jgi:hypothetical protein
MAFTGEKRRDPPTGEAESSLRLEGAMASAVEVRVHTTKAETPDQLTGFPQ